MEYGIFKALLGLLFFGSVFVFGFWQLAALRRDERRRPPQPQGDRPRDDA